ncbi:MarR family transcriptional regulator [Virgibacillus halophilus]|uniref:MarR family transcriptional regulator n=1 Tax=Tigheibacillus halophilus TaxID=361280 RepID=A0ABU5C772_9BACI|nr:MarR family transcriptional regulator [Virgibacillus halophilus]
MKNSDFLELEKAIRKIMHIGSNEWKRHVSLEFTRTEALVLYKLNKMGPQRASQLASSLFVTTGGLTGITDKLVNKGYIDRKRDDQDRRVVYLSLTDKGKKALHVMYTSRQDFIGLLFDGISDKELEQLLQIIKKDANQSGIRTRK